MGEGLAKMVRGDISVIAKMNICFKSASFDRKDESFPAECFSFFKRDVDLKKNIRRCNHSIGTRMML